MSSSCSSNPGCADVLSDYRGDTWQFDLELTVDGTPEDLSGATLQFMLKNDPSDADADAVLVASSTVASSPDAQAGHATLVVPSDQTAVVAPGSYWYSLKRILAGTPPDVWTIQAGQYEVEAV